jgi:uncharacterized membrane protein
MKIFVLSYLAALLPFVVLDAIWLSTMAKRLYSPNIGHLMAESPNFGAAAIFYLLYIAGMVVFVIQPALENDTSLQKVLLLGAFFGLITYATYDLTNLATLKNWSLWVTIVDLAWGTFLGAAVCGIATLLLRKFL